MHATAQRVLKLDDLRYEVKVDHEILCGSEKAERIYNVMLWPRMCSDYYSHFKWVAKRKGLETLTQVFAV